MANYENVEKLNELTENGKGALPALQKKVSATEREISELLKKLNAIETASQEKKAARLAEESRQAQEAKPVVAEAPAAPVEKKETAVTEEKAAPVDKKPASEKAQKPAAEKPAEKTVEKPAEKTVEKAVEKTDRKSVV